MIIRKYIVKNMNEAMIKIKNDLGSEATIVSSKRVRVSGALGLFKKKMIEVTAAVDKVHQKPVVVDKKPSESVESFKESKVEKEINELKKMIENLGSKTASSYLEVAATLTHNTKSKTIQYLSSKGVDNELLGEIESSIKLLIESSDEVVRDNDIEKRALDSIVNLIDIRDEEEERIKVLIGPTGVGKTTTIAKLASMYTLYKRKKVGLITLDTYRIGAVEQLKTYAEILNIPFEVVISSKDVEQALDRMSNCDIVLVDTTGRSSKNFMQISEIRNLVKEFNPDSIHLVLSVTTKDKDMKSIIENYSTLNYQSIILTKVDETDEYGGILNSLYYSKMPIAYICNGQDVPDDIEVPSKDKIYNIVLGDMENGPSR
ncbi:flagellar biosynthesis protein FlhF [Clostridium cylindrosporum]|uniref:Flagellar biosynthesis protein FlhF n=1 Tax=Clostridium cylindrosporum DSM 605 TaxID=1121307 RepID=A0A0J8D6K6_CLOCY|nr:flagellar biosynthesis protein FlhF [Clostridium cylindrosporum]KMT21715.1 flagellar biosynthesis protein FlhF [Clostridium cylindrosporum DSM 605]